MRSLWSLFAPEEVELPEDWEEPMKGSVLVEVRAIRMPTDTLMVKDSM